MYLFVQYLNVLCTLAKYTDLQIPYILEYEWIAETEI